jgi:hypothetical protein
MRKLLTTTALVGAVLWSTPSPATLQLQTGLVGGSGDVSNVIFNACGTGRHYGLYGPGLPQHQPLDPR